MNNTLAKVMGVAGIVLGVLAIMGGLTDETGDGGYTVVGGLIWIAQSSALVWYATKAASAERKAEIAEAVQAELTK